MKQLLKLNEMNACDEAIDWIKTQPDWATAWNTCVRGEWMLWLLGRLSKGPESKSRKLLVLTSCECVRLSLKYVTKGEDSPLIAIKTAEKWARGLATLQEVKKAAASAYVATADAAYAVDDAAVDSAASVAYGAAADAAVDAAYVAYAAASVAYAAYAAADAAAYVAYGAAVDAAADAADAAKAKTLKQCADIVRKHYPKAPKI